MRGPGGAGVRRGRSSALNALGVPAAKGGAGHGLTVEETLRVVVGPWAALRDDHALRLLEAGPAGSGVFARPSADGRRIVALDARGRPCGRSAPAPA